MGWVKEIIEGRRSLQKGIPDVWMRLHDSLQLAVMEFNEAQAQNIAPVSLHVRDDGNVIQVRQYSSLSDRGMQIVFDRRAATITSARSGYRCELGFALDNEGNVGLTMDGKSVMVEQASRLILEPFLFA